MKKLSVQTKSFIILFSIAFIGTYAALLVTRHMHLKLPDNSYNRNGDYTTISYSNGIETANAAEPEELVVDTTNWKTYTNETFGFSFKYKPDWQVKEAVDKGSFTLIEIDPGKKFYNIKAYVSNKGYYGMDSLPLQEETVAGSKAYNVLGLLYGIEHNSFYYTFDVGLSVSLKPEFKAMVHSVEFKQ